MRFLNVASLLAVLILIGCAWQEKAKSGLSSTHQATKQVSALGVPIFDKKCGDRAKKCKDANDKDCKSLKECVDEFKTFNKAVKSIHVGVAAGLTLVAINHKDEALKMIFKTTLALKNLYDLAKKSGVIWNP